MNFNMQNGDSFFKILRMESEVVLPLPSVFAKKHLEKGHNETQPIILETISGYKWKVKYAKINNDKYYFVDGWFDFMKANRLKKHDFVVFWLTSPPPNTVFQVFFYALNECLKEPVTVMNNDIPPVSPNVGHRSDDSDVADESDGYKPSIVKETRENHLLKNKTLFEKPLMKDFERVTGIDSQDRKLVRVKNDEGKIYKMFIKSWKMGPKSVPIPHLVRGWSAFMKDNNVEVGDTCVFNHVEGKLLHVHVKKGFKGN
ncbi:DNA-binding pseudobarrel domain-containing protein [Tanacetum coccineum]